MLGLSEERRQDERASAAIDAAMQVLKHHRKEAMRYMEADHCPTCLAKWPCDPAIVASWVLGREP